MGLYNNSKISDDYVYGTLKPEHTMKSTSQDRLNQRLEEIKISREYKSYGERFYNDIQTICESFYNKTGETRNQCGKLYINFSIFGIILIILVIFTYIIRKRKKKK